MLLLFFHNIDATQIPYCRILIRGFKLNTRSKNPCFSKSNILCISYNINIVSRLETFLISINTIHLKYYLLNTIYFYRYSCKRTDFRKYSEKEERIRTSTFHVVQCSSSTNYPDNKKQTSSR